jgi:hypothetical protein
MHIFRRPAWALQAILQVAFVFESTFASQHPLLNSAGWGSQPWAPRRVLDDYHNNFMSTDRVRSWDRYDEGLFTPLENLNLLSETQFTVLRHPVFPHHGVRIKKSSFCDETAQ